MSKKEDYNGKTLCVRGSRKVYLPIYLMVIILIGAMIFVKYQGLNLSKTSLALVAVFILIGLKGTEVHRFRTKYEIVPPSLIHTVGVFNRKKRRVDLFAISDVDASQNFWQMLLGYGDVNVRLFSKDSTTPIKNINNPDKFAKFLEQRMVELRTGGIKDAPHP